MANATVAHKNTGDTLSADELNDIVTAVNSKADTGEVGVKGDKGDPGATGATGPGVPDGGTTGQVLAKTGNANQATGWVTSESSGGSSLPVSIADTNSIPFTNMLTMIDQHVLTADLVITPNTVGAIAGCGAVQRIVSNAANVPDISAFKLLSSSSTYDNAIGAVNIYIFFFDGMSYNVAITQNTEVILPNANIEVNAWVARLTTAGYSITIPRKAAYLDFWNTIKQNGIYSLITEAWMFEGGTAATNVLGFKGVSDGIIHGNITHTITGSKGDGSTGRMGLGISPDPGGDAISIGNSRSLHIAAYLRLNEAGSSGAGHDAIGVRGVTSTELFLSVNPLSSGYPSYFSIGGSSSQANTENTNGRFIMSNDSVSRYVYLDGTNLVSGSSAASSSINSTEISAFASLDGDLASSYSPQELGFASVGKALTTDQAIILDTALANLCIALSR